MAEKIVGRKRKSELVRLKFESEMLYLIDILKEETGRKYGFAYSPLEKVYWLVPIKRVDRRRLIYGERLIEDELKELSERAWAFYETAKRVVYVPVEKNYYEIQWGNIIFGELTPERGRYNDFSNALKIFKSSAVSNLWNYYYGKVTKGRWDLMRLLYYKEEGATPVVIKEYRTPNEAQKNVSEDFEKKIKEVEEVIGKKLPRPWR